MTIKEYNNQLKKINTKWNQEKLELDKKYAFENNPYKIDDIIKDHEKTIRIEKIMFCRTGVRTNYPECVYKGPKLTKKGIPFKSGDWDSIYQSNIKTDVKGE